MPARGRSFSEWLNAIRANPNERSPYWNAHRDEHGFRMKAQEEGLHNWADSGFNRARGTSQRYLDLIFKESEFSEDYHVAVKNSKMVTDIWYDPKGMFLKIQWVKPRTGTGSVPGIPPGSTTIYDHVPPNVFASLKAIAEATGHIGQQIWDILRVRGMAHQSNYPYTNRE